MTKAQVWMAVIVIIIIFVVAEVVIHTTHTNNQPQKQTTTTNVQTTVANDCIVMCQNVFDESDSATSSNQEQSCENVCNKSAGLPISTSTNSQ